MSTQIYSDIGVSKNQNLVQPNDSVYCTKITLSSNVDVYYLINYFNVEF